jgi:hypothetical protein
MSSDSPCTACSWTSERQDPCRYHSHVKLFYGVSDRGVWSLGSNLILKERSDSPPNFEAANIQFLNEHTTIPVPALVEEWHEADGQYFILTKRIRDEPLSAASLAAGAEPRGGSQSSPPSCSPMATASPTDRSPRTTSSGRSWLSP